MTLNPSKGGSDTGSTKAKEETIHSMNACKVNYKLFRREEFEKPFSQKRPILNWTELNLEVLKEVSWLEFIPTLLMLILQ